MKKQLTALELHYVLKELDFLIGGKIDKVYQRDKDELTLQLHVTGKGRQIVRITMPSLMYLSKYKSQQPDKPPGFCMFMRKHLANARLRTIEQKEFERIVDFTFSTKDSIFHMMIELFGEGNIILCDEEYKILSPLKGQRWKDRTIRAGIKYEHPSKDTNFLEITEKEFSDAVKSSDKESIVKILALDFGLGGVYAEEVCLRAGVDKSRKDLDPKNIKSLFLASIEIKNQDIKGQVIGEKNITPFAMKLYGSIESKSFTTFNEALDETLTEDKIQAEHEEVVSKKEKELGKINLIVEEQTKRINEIETKIKENTEKGEKIYAHYETVKQTIDGINSASKNMEWKDIKEKLKGHAIIKDVDPKSKTITLELK